MPRGSPHPHRFLAGVREHPAHPPEFKLDEIAARARNPGNEYIPHQVRARFINIPFHS